jgi:hypothetical protein
MADTQTFEMDELRAPATLSPGLSLPPARQKHGSAPLAMRGFAGRSGVRVSNQERA